MVRSPASAQNNDVRLPSLGNFQTSLHSSYFGRVSPLNSLAKASLDLGPLPKLVKPAVTDHPALGKSASDRGPQRSSSLRVEKPVKQSLPKSSSYADRIGATVPEHTPSRNPFLQLKDTVKESLPFLFSPRAPVALPRRASLTELDSIAKLREERELNEFAEQLLSARPEPRPQFQRDSLSLGSDLLRPDPPTPPTPPTPVASGSSAELLLVPQLAPPALSRKNSMRSMVGSQSTPLFGSELAPGSMEHSASDSSRPPQQQQRKMPTTPSKGALPTTPSTRLPVTPSKIPRSAGGEPQLLTPHPGLRRSRSFLLKSPKPSSYRAKYEPEMVYLLRDFYNEIVADGTLAGQEDAYYFATQKGPYADLAVVPFQLLLGHGQRLTFKALLKSIFPLANKQDMASMIFLAFPPKKGVPRPEPDPDHPEPELSDSERAEIIEVFRMFDKDNSGVITFEEFADGSRSLNINSATIHEIMDALDTNSDGVISLDEFLTAMRNLYY